MVEFRKLIAFGKSSYVISLPKKWVERNKLKRGDSIAVIHKDNSLSLSSNPNDIVDEKKRISIVVDGKNYNSVEREFFAAYMNNFNIFEFRGKKLNEIVPKIRSSADSLAGLEIMEHTTDKLVIKDFLKVAEISIDQTLRRIDLIIRAMIEDSKMTMTNEQFQHIYERDLDVNRMAYLLFRTIRFALNNPASVKDVKKSNVELLDVWTFIINMEKIGDEAKRVSKIILEANLKKKDLEDLRTLYHAVKENYLAVMKSYYNNDKILADKCATQGKVNILNFEAFLEKRDRRVLGKLIERLKALQYYIRLNSRIILDL